MTDSHPITPPPELVQQWRKSAPTARDAGATREVWIATQAARWGADQELEACVEWMRGSLTPFMPDQAADQLRAARRPKPPSLKEQALAALNIIEDKTLGPTVEEILIRRALERLQELENAQ